MNNKANIWSIISFIGSVLAVSFLVPSLVYRSKNDIARASKLRKIGHVFNLLAAIGQFGSVIQNCNAEEKGVA